MVTSDKGRALTKGFEGYKLKAYRDGAGVWTVGVGHTGPGIVAGLVITDEQAESFLTNDLAKAEHAVNAHVTAPMTQNMFDALVDFTFNLGTGALAGSKLLKFLNAGDKMEAADQFQYWDHINGVVSAGLLRRRLAEKDLFLTT